jgi:hypothetical protein
MLVTAVKYALCNFYMHTHRFFVLGDLFQVDV